MNRLPAITRIILADRPAWARVCCTYLKGVALGMTMVTGMPRRAAW